MHILVTGGLGFIGSHLVDRLLAEGHRIVVVDSCVSNCMSPEEYSDRCEVHVSPVEHMGSALMEMERFDEIYHLAGLVGPAGVLGHAGQIASETIAANQAAVELAVAHGSKLLVVSTSEVYGRPGVLSEADDIIVPAKYTVRLEYAVAKLTLEVATLNRARVSGLHANVVRPFNVSGPRQLPTGGFVLPRFVIAALLGKSITVFGTGTQIRSFSDVRDTVQALMAVNRSGRSGEVYNIGNPSNEITIESLAWKVKELLQSPSKVVHVDPKKLFGPLFEDSFDRVPDARKTRERVGWEADYSLDRTILDTAEYFRVNADLMRDVPFDVEEATRCTS